MNIVVGISCAYLFVFLFLNYVNVFKGKIIEKKNYVFLWSGVLLACCILAWFTVPHVEDDLYRYYQHLENFKLYGIQYFREFPYTNNIVTLLIFYIISIISCNNILPTISVIVFYSVLIYIIVHFYNKRQTSIFSLFVVILASFIYLNQTISGVRYPIAIAVFMFLVVWEKSKVQPICFTLLYIIPVMIHTAAIVLVALVLLVKIQKKYCFNLSNIAFVIPWMCLLLGSVLPFEIPYISKVFELLLTYANPEFFLVFIDYRVQCCYWLLFVFYIWCYFKSKEKIYSEKQDLALFYEMLLKLEIGLLPFPVIWGRYFTPMIVLSLPYMLEALEEKRENCKMNILVKILVMITSIGLFLYRMVNAYHYWRFY